MCQHSTTKSHGHDARGRRRLKCHDCGITFLEQPRKYPWSHLPESLDDKIFSMLQNGVGVRETARRLGISRDTVSVRNKKLPHAVKSMANRVGYKCCDYCGFTLSGEKNFYRRKRRVKHKFCGHDCFMAFMALQRKKDKCARCGRCREEISSGNMSRGYCPGCYSLLRQFGFDEEVVAAYELTQVLKKEIKNVGNDERELIALEGVIWSAVAALSTGLESNCGMWRCNLEAIRDRLADYGREVRDYNDQHVE